jgi:hypothetical protein
VARQRESWTAEASAAVRTIAAFVAATAMLLQLFLAAPLAMRMPPEAGSTAWPVVLCGMRSSGGAADPARTPVVPHQHDDCPVCQSNSMPLGILAGAMLLFVVAATCRRYLWTAVVAPAPARPFRLYGSRAPPALA